MKAVLPFIACFCMTLVTEWCWARYNIAASRRLPLPAALWSAGIVLVGNLSLMLWLDNHWTLIASVAASLIGTYSAVKYHKAEDAAAAPKEGTLAELFHHQENSE